MIFQRSVFAFMPLSLLMLRLYRVSFFYTPLCRTTVSIGRACIISALKLSGNSVCDWQRWHHRSCHPVQMVCHLDNIFFPFGRTLSSCTWRTATTCQHVACGRWPASGTHWCPLASSAALTSSTGGAELRWPAPRKMTMTKRMKGQPGLRWTTISTFRWERGLLYQ